MANLNTVYTKKSREKRVARDPVYKAHLALKARESSTRYRSLHPERVKESQRTYKSSNRDKINTYERNRRLNDPQFQMAYHNRILINQALNKAGSGKTASTKALLGGSVAEAVKYLEDQFGPGMTWENHGEWHIDHILPLAAFELQNSEEQEVAFHFTNLQPLWAEDNLRKSDRLTA